ncbi:hypothetical protein ACTU44_16080 [Thalassospira sp. SM2505]
MRKGHTFGSGQQAKFFYGSAGWYIQEEKGSLADLDGYGGAEGLDDGSDDPDDDDDEDQDDGKNNLPWYGKLDPRFIGDGTGFKEHFDYGSSGSGEEDDETTEDEP